MKNKPVGKVTVPAKAKGDGISSLFAEVRNLIQSARRSAASFVDTLQVMTNFEIGRRIVVHEQQGKKRAAYGAELLKELSARLTVEFGRGFSKANIEYMKRFYLLWQEKVPIFPKVFDTLAIPQTASGQLAANEIAQTPSGQFGPIRFFLSWSHYVVLMGIKDSNERSFYEIESRQSNWNVRELKRQKASALYHRLALSRDKAGVKRLAAEGQIITKPEDVLKNPLVLEFLGLDEKAGYSESNL